MLEFTALLTWLIGKPQDTAIVLCLLAFNAAIGWLQEEKANAALEALQQKLMVSVKVKRDGTWTTVPAKELVPGDVIRLRAGDLVPADVKVIEGSTDVDQSALTGESLPVTGGPGDGLFSGSTVSRGEVTGVVTATGTRTYFGKTIQLLKVARPKTHTEEITAKVARLLFVLVAVFVAAGIGVALIRHVSLLEILPLAAMLLISAVPVALPTMFAISMAVGAQKLSKEGVLVTRLNASEDAATMDVLCVDKTGTLTYNRLSIAEIVPLGRASKEEVILYGALASREENQDPIDLAFLAESREMKLPVDSFVQKCFTPFDPATRMTKAEVENSEGRISVAKGAVNAILGTCIRIEERSENAQKEVESLSERGYRAIAVARGPDDCHMRIVGVVGLHDAPRPGSAPLVADLKKMGVSVKMLTGDALPIAREVAKRVGIEGCIVRAGDLKARHAEAESCAGFAGIFPEDKYLIVRDLQGAGHVVGMTGDGVNDVPALRQAEVGIAVSNATDVAKKAASVVLTAPGLEGIVDLIEAGRMIFRRTATWVSNKIVKTVQVVAFVILAFLMTGQFVVTVSSMVLLLFLTDFVTLSLSTDNVRISPIPERWDIARIAMAAALLGTLTVAESLAALYAGIAWLGLDTGQLQTYVLAFLVLTGIFNVLVLRERGHFWQSMPGRLLIVAIGGDVVVVSALSLAGVLGLLPIGPAAVLVALAASAIACFIVNDQAKVLIAKYLR